MAPPHRVEFSERKEDGEAPTCLATEAPPPAQARVRGAARRLVKMILGTDGRCNDPALAATGCPACGAVGRFAPHSSYRRHLEDLEGGELVCGTVAYLGRVEEEQVPFLRAAYSKRKPRLVWDDEAGS